MLDPSGAPVPSRIGRYAVEGVLGEGGMGTVYRARQENPSRLVALKVIRAGFLSDEVLRRFTRESQVLGRLQHPGIAQVYEAGMAEDDRGASLPYFAMEFVRGVPLTTFADRKRLGTRERLDLIARISDAVEHAHQKGVIHRDLKPGNILVDESGQPRILDFGVARATDGDLQQTTLQTDIGQLMGTIPYMSPEQIGGNPDELDTRSDVYALGVVAFELLVGKRPHDLERKMIHEAARIIREDEPTRLSSLNRTLRGDVETIVGKALEKDKSRRYPSADAFASDIRRYLRDEPISARPPSTWYQLRKFSRRNTGLVAGVGVALLLLVAGIVGTGIALRRALRAESGLTAQLAKTESARHRAESINSFVIKALRSSDPMLDGRRGATIAEAMRGAVREIEAGAFQAEPETETELRETIATILKNDGKYEEAEALLRDAVAMEERLFGRDSPVLAGSLKDLGNVHLLQHDYAQAGPLLERSLAILEKAYGPEHSEVADALNSLAELEYEQHHLDRAKTLFERALAAREKALGPDHLNVAQTLNDLALVELDREQYDLAEQRMRQALAIIEKQRGADHPDVAACLNSLALLYEGRGKNDLAESNYVRALSICERALGPEHALVATGQYNLGDLYKKEGRLDEARTLFERALAIREKILGAEHPDVGIVLDGLARIDQDQGRDAQAEEHWLRVLAIDEKADGPEDVEVAKDLQYVARVRQRLGKTAEARGDFDRAIGILRRNAPGGSPTLAHVLGFSGSARLENGDAAAALPELEEALALGEKHFPPGDPKLDGFRRSIASCRAALGQ